MTAPSRTLSRNLSQLLFKIHPLFNQTNNLPQFEQLKKGSTLIAPKESKDAVDMALEQLILYSNEKEARSLLKEMAQDGKVKALRELGLLHYKEREYIEARKNFLKASLGEDPESTRYLGIMYFLGQGVDLDYSKAIEWLEQSQKLGDREKVATFA